MKRTESEKILKKNGWYLLRNGANHDIFTNGEYNIPVPRHREVKENTAFRL